MSQEGFSGKQVGVVSILVLLLSLGIGYSPSLFEEDQYFCESRPQLGLLECEGFSKYVSSVGKCLNSEEGNRICREGWVLVVDDMPPYDEENDGEQYLPDREGLTLRCSKDGCVPVSGG